jgi:hypothetical protein
MIAYITDNLIYNLITWVFNPFTNNIDAASVPTADISGGLDNLLLTNGDFLILTSDTGDVLLLTSA